MKKLLAQKQTFKNSGLMAGAYKNRIDKSGLMILSQLYIKILGIIRDNKNWDIINDK